MNFCKVIFLLFIVKLSLCNKYRLPTSVIPKRYELKILTTLRKEDPNDFVFEGHTKIEVECHEKTDQITLHSRELKIVKEGLSVTNLQTNAPVKVLRFDLIPEYDFLKIHLETHLEKHKKYEVNIAFSGIISQDLKGFYRSCYKNDQTVTWLATTQFEPTDARSAFPCWDEPMHKAKFKISIGHHKELHSISNMPKEKTLTLNDSFVLDIFQETVLMSTYLVAYVISDFGYVSSPPGLSKTEFKIWTRKSALSQTKFASEVGPKALSYFEKSLGIPYALPKVDMIAIPQFPTGAMENWGLITYLESNLLSDGESDTKYHKSTVAKAICHELSHQWFGNLVTMKWWKDIWLNEGFATYMEIHCVDDLFPDWNYAHENFALCMDIVFTQDMLKSSHAISSPVEDEIAHNTITYQKGGLIIRMMERTLGATVFNKGITRYLNNHSYSNAEQDDLWATWTHIARTRGIMSFQVDVKHVMDSWTLQPGYPIVDVKRNYRTGLIEFAQRRYERSTTKNNGSMCWWIPLTYTTADVRNFKHTFSKLWLSCPRTNQTIYYKDKKNWIIFNIRQSGLYRVNYDRRNWKLIKTHLKHKNIEDINEINRYGLIDNVMSLGETNNINYRFVFELVSYLPREPKYLPWKVAFKYLNKLSMLLEKSDADHLIKKYVRKLLKKKYGRSLFQEEDLSDLQILFSKVACKYELERCEKDANDTFHAYMKDPSYVVHNELRYTVYCTGLKLGGEKEWNFLWKKYALGKAASERETIVLLTAISCTREKDYLDKYLNFIVSGTADVKKKDALTVFQVVAKSKEGYEVAKKFLYKNAEKILKLYLPEGSVIIHYINSIASRITKYSELLEFEDFLAQHPELDKFMRENKEHALDEARWNIHWFAKNYDDIVTTLKKRTHSY